MRIGSHIPRNLTCPLNGRDNEDNIILLGAVQIATGWKWIVQWNSIFLCCQDDRNSPRAHPAPVLGDAALSRLSLGEPLGEAHPGLTWVNAGRGEPISQYPLQGLLGPSTSLLIVNVQPVIGAVAFELSPQ